MPTNEKRISMGRKKRKHPHRHTGKVLPLRTESQVKEEIVVSAQKPNLNKWRDCISAIVQSELEFVEDESDMRQFKDRTAELAEAMAFLDLIQQRYLHDKNGNPVDVSNVDATFLANNAIRAGYLIGKSAARASMEAHAVEGLEQSERGLRQAKANAAGKSTVTRDELLALCKAAYQRHQCNQRELFEHVAAKLPVKKDRVKALMQEHGIKKKDYI
ncbi:hypothetical protein NHH03_25290 [Stieleria sp. TO1_6]|uniref:hypothetical protein n=1 Tax=Stieleria tagensis TaxID=2956795 RepID=UPI00209B8B14|nr:hypothetical protein [Stieleria tagensis]MCO8125076.1 hypothetical protein [Stieleria tagensis]